MSNHAVELEETRMTTHLSRTLAFLTVLVGIAAPCFGAATHGTRTFDGAAGQTLRLDLQAGGTVTITGGASTTTVTWEASGLSANDCRIDFEQRADGLTVTTDYIDRGNVHSTSIDLQIEVPRFQDVAIDSVGGSLTLRDLEGTFSGKTMGGGLTLGDVRGRAELKTMGGPIRLTDSDLDGSLETMGGEVLFENVVGDVTGSSMGGNVRYKNVVRRSGEIASPSRVGGGDATTTETVQISTMGGTIEVDEAPEGADLHTMGGNVRVTDASRFVRAKTMGGDIEIDAVDGWVVATTMGGDVEVTLVGSGGDVDLTSMSGDIKLVVPAGFSMDLDLEIAFTRGSSQAYRIFGDFDLQPSVTADWDYDRGSPRKYIRATGPVAGGAHRVKIRTVNGNIELRTGR